MSLASKNWVDKRIDESRRPAHPPRLSAPGAAFDWSVVALGYKINPNGNDTDEVRIYAGEIDRVSVAQTDVTVADGDYVYVRRTLADDTMLVTNAASVPANTGTYRYYRLYKFSVSDEVASISAIYRAFDIEVGKGYSGDITRVSNVYLDGLDLKQTKITDTYANGLLISSADSVTSTIFTFENCT